MQLQILKLGHELVVRQIPPVEGRVVVVEFLVFTRHFRIVFCRRLERLTHADEHLLLGRLALVSLRAGTESRLHCRRHSFLFKFESL